MYALPPAFNRLIFLFVYKRAATQFLKALVHHADQKKAGGQNLHRLADKTIFITWLRRRELFAEDNKVWSEK
jgi:hypothetical protein